MSHTPSFLRRRDLLGVAASSSLLGLAGTARAVTEEALFPVVETSNGRLRGLMSGGIAVFKGVRYGASTAGANRFMPPQPVPRWSGVKDATAYGNYAPQMPADRRRAYADLIMYDLQPGGMGEDCLVLNVWTPTLAKNAKRPVLVHLHGGGFYAGSGNSPQFDGEMMARFGDAVFVTVNHRLGAFGYLNLAELGGDRYARSGAAGMLDIVAALGWVAENIASFGGDPSRVLVFGQSGGGLKTSVLMAMPSAKGLFHRAGVMSGAGLRVATPESSAKAADVFVRELGLGKPTLSKLETLPFEQLLAAQVTMEDADRAKGEAPRSFSPVLDGVAIPRHPFDPDAPAISGDVPMIVSTVLDERAYRKVNFDLDEAGLRRFGQDAAGGDGDKVVAMYREEDRAATPFVLQARIDTDMTFRRAAHLQAERKATLAASAQAAPVYAYLWKTPSPAYGGRYGAPHGTDIGPSLHDIRNGLNGPSAESIGLADQLASAWVSFAATGDPNNARTPRWPAYTLPQRSTLVFDGPASRTQAQDDPRKTFREYWALPKSS
ncbi:MAG: carboxylesterase/lipase family protein [Comamonadaceae bacterium]|nr:MAG: carboxylesterase/lipase family protein [Comamonadaceae bacterium]